MTPEQADELLALLKEAGEFIQPFNRAQDLYDRIEAAIARAEGRPLPPPPGE